ncbi:hypothetical protein BU24DRAFT_344776 [Aaosphaeria arxii CBS 175.79]|uniref:Mediator of RNA polymerase II transcription subunit 18 n=1 Tax=Aaosphaeria arxii CBS 175.79 TaxID=1450172 RepID=A0A6A5Y006_9PLEO|nr:uncharacterized protein BU24DRAFT_344776 [Aaosphaeria arxii CBS 175.79]KAF2018170.1 hypothetical protein BU24DRAFT_344776 [Aaosphaeria arxii CBS 175.79]
MYELLLYGQVPQTRHEQVLKVLAGVAAMQPRRIVKRHIVYRPTREPEEPGSNLRRGGSQAVAVKNTARPGGSKPLYFTHLVQRLPESFERENTRSTEDDPAVAKQDAVSESQWSHEWHDLPDPVDRGVLVRQTTNSGAIEGNAHAYAIALGNKFVSEFYIEGNQYVLGNVVIFLHRILHEPGVRSLETEPKIDLPSFSALSPLDPSGAYILEAKIRVQDLNNPALLDTGIQELQGFKKHMKGCVELHVPDRLTLDTRVKYQPRGIAPPNHQVAAR